MKWNLKKLRFDFLVVCERKLYATCFEMKAKLN